MCTETLLLHSLCFSSDVTIIREGGKERKREDLVMMMMNNVPFRQCFAAVFARSIAESDRKRKAKAMSVHFHLDVIALGSLSFLLFSVYVEAGREREKKTDNVNSEQLVFSTRKSIREEEDDEEKPEKETKQ